MNNWNTTRFKFVLRSINSKEKAEIETQKLRKEEQALLSVLLFGGRLGYEFSDIEKKIIPQLQKKYHSSPEIIDIEFTTQEKEWIRQLKVQYKSSLEKYK